MQVASLVYLVVGGALALGIEAPPSHLVVAHEHPGHGLPSLLLVIGALGIFAWSLGWSERYRLQAAWVGGALSEFYLDRFRTILIS